MICEHCGTLDEDCECDEDSFVEDPDFGDDEWTLGYDGDAL